MTPVRTLNDGTTMPVLGLGLWQVPDEDAEAVVRDAISLGYRGFDTAASYRNERAVGAAVASCPVPRDELLVSTKLWNGEHGADEARRAFDASLEKLNLDRVDLYLIHWPMPLRDRYVETWRALEKIQAEGRIRTLGVSNFTPGQIQRLIDNSDTVPAVNQVELHPLFQQRELREFHAEHDIATQAWSPLGSGQLLDLPLFAEIARAHDRSPAQIVLRWHLQLGTLVIPKTVTPARLAENLDVFDFELSEPEMAAIAALDTGERFGPDPETFDFG